MDYYSINKDRYQEVKKLISTLNEKILQYPEGHLLVEEKKSRTFYKRYLGKKNISYIPVSNQELIINLAGKTLLKKRLLYLENESKGLEKYFSCYDGDAYEKYLNENKEIRRLAELNGVTGQGSYNKKGKSALNLLQDADWIEKISQNELMYQLLCSHIVEDAFGNRTWNYNGGNNASHQERRIVNTLCGVLVRSKSEAMIANALYNEGILFLYEPDVKIRNKIYHPDFLLFLSSGKIVIFEHAGMMFDKASESLYTDVERNDAINYTQNFAAKIYNYILGGWILGINLFVTSETKFQPFDSSTFDKIIKDQLLI